MMQVDALRPFPRNARIHPTKQVDQLAASITEFGWTIPVLVDEDHEIIAGHGRLLAAKKLGIKEVPVMIAVGWSDEQKRAYRIADNQLTVNAAWDEVFLKTELDDLAEAGFNIDLIGFDPVDDLDGVTDGKASGVLAEVFGVPPFTVLNAREGWWQDRKRAWIAMGIKSELGRLGGK